MEVRGSTGAAGRLFVRIIWHLNARSYENLYEDLY